MPPNNKKVITMVFKILIIAYICLLMLWIIRLKSRISQLEQHLMIVAQKLYEAIRELNG